MIATDEGGRIQELNAETIMLFGYSREELIGRNVEELIPDRLKDVHQRHREHYQATPEYRPMSLGHRLFALRKDGSEFPVEISLGPVRTDGETLYYCIVRDVSEHEAALEVERHLKFEQALAGL